MRLPALFVALFCSVSLLAQPVAKDGTCDTSRLPIVFVHGFLGSGDNWSLQLQRFSRNGYCPKRLFVFDWNTINRSQSTDSLLDVFIDGVLASTNATQVELVGHSAGGGLCYNYLSKRSHAIKVAHYVHIGSSKMSASAGQEVQVPTMNIYSSADFIIRNGGEIPGAQNVQLQNADHMQVATGEETFAHLYRFFNNGQPPSVTRLIPSGKLKQPIFISGKGTTLGENKPLTADSFRVFLYDPLTGKRKLVKKRGSNDGAFVGWTTFGINGEFTISCEAGQALEFEVKPKGGRRLYYFFEPFSYPNPAVYLRTFPTTGMVAGILKQVPQNDSQSALVVFSSNQAILAGRDTLTLDSLVLSIPQLAAASKTMIATFLFDDGDQTTTLQPLKSFGSFPFLGSADVQIPVNANKTMRVFYNGRALVLPKRASADGVIIAVFHNP
jgi:predicted alpha/beta hydrolase family esterase